VVASQTPEHTLASALYMDMQMNEDSPFRPEEDGGFWMLECSHCPVAEWDCAAVAMTLPCCCCCRQVWAPRVGGSHMSCCAHLDSRPALLMT